MLKLRFVVVSSSSTSLWVFSSVRSTFCCDEELNILGEDQFLDWLFCCKRATIQVQAGSLSIGMLKSFLRHRSWIYGLLAQYVHRSAKTGRFALLHFDVTSEGSPSSSWSHQRNHRLDIGCRRCHSNCHFLQKGLVVGSVEFRVSWLGRARSLYRMVREVGFFPSAIILKYDRISKLTVSAVDVVARFGRVARYMNPKE